MKRFLAESGGSSCDLTEGAGWAPTLVNMGVCALIGLGYVLLVGADLNGPVIGALFTILRFAACGKHPRNIVPILAGVLLMSLAVTGRAAEPNVVLAALFGTAPGPGSGRSGWPWGVGAGAVHVLPPSGSWGSRSADSTCTTTASSPASSAQWPSPYAAGGGHCDDYALRP